MATEMATTIPTTVTAALQWTRLSPRIDYLAPSGPPRHPSYYPNPYSTGMGHPHRSQSPQSVGYGVQRSDSANQIPSSTSPHTVHPSIPTPAGSNERPSQLPSDPPHTGHPSIPIPAGGDKRLLRSPPAANHSTPEPVRVDNTPSNQLPPLPPVAGTKVSKPARASESLSEPPALALTANPIVVEPMEGQERLTRLSPIPLVATQPTILDSTPAPSSVAKKPGRQSNKSLGFIASTFTHLDEIIHDLASQTGMTWMQLIA
jgi:hypothetical protein